MKQSGEFRQYWIVFTDEARLNWFYKLFTRKGLRHCEIFMDVGRACLSVSQTLENVEVTTYPFCIDTAVSRLRAKGSKILYLSTFKKTRKLRFGLFVPSCVAQCMMITGVSFNAVSVHGYYKALKRYGAVEIRDIQGD